jgi:hypothetical protein
LSIFGKLGFFEASHTTKDNFYYLLLPQTLPKRGTANNPGQRSTIEPPTSQVVTRNEPETIENEWETNGKRSVFVLVVFGIGWYQVGNWLVGGIELDGSDAIL